MWDTILPTMVGGLLAIGGGFAGTAFTSNVERRNRRKAVAGAIGGEIGALIEICEFRRYLEGFDALIAHGERTGEEQGFGLAVRQNYFVVFDAHVASVGSLPPAMARDVVRFYVMAKSFLEDAVDAIEGSIPPGEALQRLRTTRSLLDEILGLGRVLVTRLDAISR
ncbi:MAG: hypothetical protein U0974_01225 [Gemmatimonadales bacterium]|nr:hypothetical protein [Gemmatimonadales bacterium]MDZ4388337.1 hypothetical protein [Gemmatimonadales bacterium]